MGNREGRGNIEMFLTNKIDWVTANYLFKFIWSSRNDEKQK